MAASNFPSQPLVFSSSQRYDLGELRADAKEEFRDELESLINKYSIENGSDSPDWLLAEYLVGCLDVFDRAVRSRDQQYGIEGIPCNPRICPDEEE